MEDLFICVAIVLVAILSFFAGFGVSRFLYFDFFEKFHEQRRAVIPPSQTLPPVPSQSLPPLPDFNDDLEIPKPPAGDLQRPSVHIKKDQVIRKGVDFESL